MYAPEQLVHGAEIVQGTSKPHPICRLGKWAALWCRIRPRRNQLYEGFLMALRTSGNCRRRNAVEKWSEKTDTLADLNILASHLAGYRSSALSMTSNASLIRIIWIITISERCFVDGNIREVTIRIRSTFFSSEFGMLFQAEICAFNAVAERKVSKSDRTCYLVPRDSL